MRKLILHMSLPDAPEDEPDVVEIELPWRWEICHRCDGHNRTCAHVEMPGGGFTASEWAEQDEDFREDYLAGRYDRPCPECEGGKVKVADYSRMTDEQIKQWEEQLRFDAECEAERRHERMMLGDY